MAKPAKKSKPALPGKRTLCPFSGNPLQIVAVTATAAGHPVEKFQVRGTGWVSTSLFHTRGEAEWYFSHDHGVEPDLENPYRRAEVVGVVEPPDPSALAVEQEARDTMNLAEAAADVAKDILK